MIQEDKTSNENVGHCLICGKQLRKYEIHVQEFHVECTRVGCSFDLLEKDWETLKLNINDREVMMSRRMRDILVNNGVDPQLIGVATMVADFMNDADY